MAWPPTCPRPVHHMDGCDSANPLSWFALEFSTGWVVGLQHTSTSGSTFVFALLADGPPPLPGAQGVGSPGAIQHEAPRLTMSSDEGSSTVAMTRTGLVAHPSSSSIDPRPAIPRAPIDWRPSTRHSVILPGRRGRPPFRSRRHRAEICDDPLRRVPADVGGEEPSYPIALLAAGSLLNATEALLTGAVDNGVRAHPRRPDTTRAHRQLGSACSTTWPSWLTTRSRPTALKRVLVSIGTCTMAMASRPVLDDPRVLYFSIHRQGLVFPQRARARGRDRRRRRLQCERSTADHRAGNNMYDASSRAFSSPSAAATGPSSSSWRQLRRPTFSTTWA